MWMIPRWVIRPSWQKLRSALRPAHLPLRAVAALVPFVDVGVRKISGGDQEIDIRDAEVWRRATQHPGRRIFLVLIDALIEIDLIQIAEQSKPVQRNSPVTTPLS